MTFVAAPEIGALPEISEEESNALETLLHIAVEQRKNLLGESINLQQLNVNLEGAPIYLVPNPDQPVQSWTNAAFMRSWHILSQLHERMNKAPVAGVDTTPTHWMLIDNVHNMEGVDDAEYETRMYELLNGVLANVPLEGVTLETDYQYDEGDSCSEMDSRFQADKNMYPLRPLLGEAKRINGGQDAVWSGRRNNIVNPIRQGNWTYKANGHQEPLPLPINIIIHPQQFKGQQEDMLRELRASINEHQTLQSAQNGSVMTHSRDYALNTSSFVQQTFNVWLDDETGQIVEITQPQFREDGKLYHQTLISLRP